MSDSVVSTAAGFNIYPSMLWKWASPDMREKIEAAVIVKKYHTVKSCTRLASRTSLSPGKQAMWKNLRELHTMNTKCSVLEDVKSVGVGLK